jgi:hypothetical protein
MPPCRLHISKIVAAFRRESSALNKGLEKPDGEPTPATHTAFRLPQPTASVVLILGAEAGQFTDSRK